VPREPLHADAMGTDQLPQGRESMTETSTQSTVDRDEKTSFAEHYAPRVAAIKLGGA
jgi:hypothetical protein